MYESLGYVRKSQKCAEVSKMCGIAEVSEICGSLRSVLNTGWEKLKTFVFFNNLKIKEEQVLKSV